MIKNKEYKKQVLAENYRQTTNNPELTLLMYATIESINDPFFYNWLFDEDMGDYGKNLTDEELQEASDFIQEL